MNALKLISNIIFRLVTHMERKHTHMDAYSDTKTQIPLKWTYMPYLCWGDLSLSLFVLPERAGKKKQNLNVLMSVLLHFLLMLLILGWWVFNFNSYSHQNICNGFQFPSKNHFLETGSFNLWIPVIFSQFCLKNKSPLNLKKWITTKMFITKCLKLNTNLSPTCSRNK